MPMFQFSFNNESELVSALQEFHETGIDPAFDSDMDELERQFQELRFTSCSL